MYALVDAYYLTVKNEVSGGGQSGSSAQPADIILVGDEAYLHAVGLVGDGKAEFLGQLPHSDLFIGAEGEDKPVELLPFYAAEHIALVIAGQTLIQNAVFGSGVVAGRNVLSARFVGKLKQ